MNTSDTSWYRAQYECQRKNATLIEIHDPHNYNPTKKYDFDNNIIDTRLRYWIGATNEKLIWTSGFKSIYILNNII